MSSASLLPARCTACPQAVSLDSRWFVDVRLATGGTGILLRTPSTRAYFYHKAPNGKYCLSNAVVRTDE